MSQSRTLSDLLPGLTKGILGRKGMLFGKLIMDWPHIAGPEIAARTTPVDLKFAKKTDQKSQAVLHLAVAPAFALEVSYQKSLLIERLNMFFGYPAIKDIKIIQQITIMNNKKGNSVISRPLTQQEQQDIDGIVGRIGENDLQTALKNLGKAIISRQTKD